MKKVSPDMTLGDATENFQITSNWNQCRSFPIHRMARESATDILFSEKVMNAIVTTVFASRDESRRPARAKYVQYVEINSQQKKEIQLMTWS